MLAHPATEAWLSVVRAYNHCSRALAAAVAPLGLTLLQHEILLNLLREPGLAQAQLARRCFSAKSGISREVSAFERDGIVLREADAADARVLRLTLTPQGRALAGAALARQNGVVAAMAAIFPARELERLTEHMDALSAVLRGLDEQG